MKKTMFILLFSFVLLSSCQPRTTEDTFIEYGSLTEYIENCQLPDNFILSFDADTILYREKAFIYSAKDMMFNAEDLISNFLHDKVAEIESWAVGKRYISDNDDLREYLTVYDGGESFGINVGIKGGFQYVMEKNGSLQFANQQYVIENAGYQITDSSLSRIYTKKTDYSSFTDLSFHPYRDTEMEILSVLESAGVPEFQISEAYSLDYDTMRQHAENFRNLWNYDLDCQYTKADEGYLFYISQSISGIPIINQGWNGQGGASMLYGNPMNYTSGTVFYNENGLVYADFTSLLDVKEIKKEENLLTPVTAFNTLMAYYKDIIILGTVDVESMQLRYVTLNKEAPYELRPAWIFYLLVTTPTEEIGDVQHYELFIVDAVTGIKLNG